MEEASWRNGRYVESRGFHNRRRRSGCSGHQRQLRQWKLAAYHWRPPLESVSGDSAVAALDDSFTPFLQSMRRLLGSSEG